MKMRDRQAVAGRRLFFCVGEKNAASSDLLFENGGREDAEFRKGKPG